MLTELKAEKEGSVNEKRRQRRRKSSREDRSREPLLEKLRLLFDPVNDPHQRLHLVVSVESEELGGLGRVGAEGLLPNVICDLVELLVVRRVSSDELGFSEILEDHDEGLDVSGLELGEVVEGGMKGSKEVVPEGAKDLEEVAALEEGKN